MRDKGRKFRTWGLLLLFLMFAAGFTSHVTVQEAQAATAGFRTVNGKRYYVKSNGSYQKGWLTLRGQRYYFDKKTGEQLKGLVKDRKGRYRFFAKNDGHMVTGWLSNKKAKRRYFDPSTGFMLTGWQDIDGATYHFSESTGYASKYWVKDKNKNTRYFTKLGKMWRGWAVDKKGVRRYFFYSEDRNLDGVMAKGFQGIDGNTYYFSKSTGAMALGWVENTKKGTTYYFDPSTGVMAKGIVEIDGKKQSFSEQGIYQGEVVETVAAPATVASTGSRTIKNYLAGALLPVGKALYIWGGGWNDSTKKGISQTWVDWYNKWSSKPGSFDYNDYRDLSAKNRAKGLDCSGFVGWAAYQVMQTQSGVGSGYTVVSGDIGSYYSKTLKWGKIINQSALSKSGWKLKPGDIGYNNGHTWIVLGQCEDKSVVIVHSTPQAGCQISGTTTPTGNADSQAAALARKYMSLYAGYSIYAYHPTAGNYIRNGNFLRWNEATLSDPEGYGDMTADEILYDLFGQ